jgi:FAD/FMN-containing dehydrogenase/Fe-S oxidoreductase
MPVSPDPTLVETKLPEPPDRIGAIDPETQADRAAIESARVLEAELTARISGEVRFDRTSRMLYSTDASNYQIEPIGVVVPKSADDAIGAVELAASHGVPILPRGGGSSLAGQTVGAALVIDFSKYCNRVLDLNLEAGTATVETGSSLDLLNRQLKANGLMFGPDPSSGNRATIGGVIGNNSTGAHSILYGMTSDNVISARVTLATGGTFELGPGSADELTALAAHSDARGRLLTHLLEFQKKHTSLIARDFPPHWRRSTGYSLNEFIKPDFNPARLLASSEGTLATVLSATMKLVPVPAKTALVILQFSELVASMEATPFILEAGPSAIELMDRMLIELTRAQPGYASKIAFVEGDPAGILCVEFYGETDAELKLKCGHLLSHLAARKVALSTDPIVVLDPKQQTDIWTVRKDGLGLLYSIRGDYKPIPVIEDVSIPVEHLPEFVGTVEKMVTGYGTTAAYYAHASAGCLHIRPLVNLKDQRGLEIMKEMADQAAEMARRLGGVMSGEHGDGLQRSELNEKIFGPELYDAMRELKQIFDPAGLMNPGKKVNAPSMIENLRLGPAYQPETLHTYFDYSREGGFLRAIEQCNGAAVCRKLKAGTMCPSFMATRDEQDTTRARANALRNALAGRASFDRSDFTSKDTYQVMDLCISCKACKTECPSSVDMAKLKMEFLAHYHDAHGTPLRSRVFGHIHTLSKLTRPIAPLANFILRTPLGRPMMQAMGVHPERKLSPFQFKTFSSWFRKHDSNISTQRSTRGKVVYFHDTFTEYNYPRIGIAAVQLLEAAGYEVLIEQRRVCCGRPMLSKGLLTDAKKAAARNVELLAPYVNAGIPIIGTEPSCILTLRDEYIDLLPGNENASAVASHSYMIDEFLAKLEQSDRLGIGWKSDPSPVMFHGHCHQKALIGMGPSMAILTAAGCRATESGAGCCGMAGSFGYEAEHYDVSRKIGEERLFPTVAEQGEETIIAVSGVSCRQQIEHFTERKTMHIVEVLASRVARPWEPQIAAEPLVESIAAD